MLVSQLSLLATAASAAAIQGRAASTAAVFEITEFVAQHNPHSADETIRFTVESKNTGLEKTICSINGYMCQHTDTLLCDVPVAGECTNKDVTFHFNKDLKSKRWGIVVDYQAPKAFYSAEYQFHRHEDTFYEYDGVEYEHLTLPGTKFTFSSADRYPNKAKRQTVGPNPIYDVTDFTAQHNPNGPDETIQFTIASKNQNLAATSCGIYGYQCQHTDYELCDISGVLGTCSNKDVTFGFTKDLKTEKWELIVHYQAESELFTSAHYFPKRQDTFYEYEGKEYEHLTPPGKKFTFQ